MGEFGRFNWPTGTSRTFCAQAESESFPIRIVRVSERWNDLLLVNSQADRGKTIAVPMADNCFDLLARR